MPWTRPTLDTIYQRIKSDMESRLTGNVALLRRAVLRVLAKVFAGAVHLLYGYLEWVSAQLFVDTAETTYLNRHGSVWGVPRKSGTFATGSVYFTGTNGTSIPSGTRVQNSDGDEYETLDTTAISGTTSPAVTAQALQSGSTPNNTSNSLEMVSPIIGVDSVSAVSGFSGGQDMESDADYRERIVARIQNPPMGGTASDYVFWAEEESGVEKAWCFPRVDGDGTVGVVIKAVGTNPVPSDSLLASVYEAIYTKMPIGAVLVHNVTRRVDPIVALDIQMSIGIIPYTTERAEAIRTAITNLFLDKGAPGEDMKISLLRDAIANNGVDDYTIMWITKDHVDQDVNANIPFSGYEYGVVDLISIFSL